MGRAAVLGLAARGTGLLGSLLITALAGRLLEPSDFAAGIVLLSVTALLPLFDIGAGYVLMTDYPKAAEHARTALSSAAFRISATSSVVVLCVALVPLFSTAPSAALGLGTGWQPRISLSVVIASMSAAFATSVRLRLLAARQNHIGQQVVSLLSYAVGYPLGLVALFVSPSLLTYAFAIALSPQIVLLIFLTGSARRYTRGHRSAGKGYYVAILRRGPGMSFGAAANAVSIQSDVVIAGALVGPDEAADLGVATRLSSLYMFCITAALAQMWPRLSHLIAIKDLESVRVVLRRVLVACLMVGASAGVLLVLAGSWAAQLIAPSVSPNSAYFYSATAWILVFAVHFPVSMYVNAAGYVRLQVATSCLMVAINVPLTVVGINVLGPWGGTLATAASVLFTTTLPYLHRLLRDVA